MQDQNVIHIRLYNTVYKQNTKETFDLRLYPLLPQESELEISKNCGGKTLCVITPNVHHGLLLNLQRERDGFPIEVHD